MQKAQVFNGSVKNRFIETNRKIWSRLKKHSWRSNNSQRVPKEKDVVIVNHSKKKYDADKTAITTFYNRGIENVFITDIFDMRVHIVRNRVSMIMGHDFTANDKIKNGVYDAIAVLITDDPSPINAGGSVSLGYGMLEWSMKNAILSKNVASGLMKYKGEQMFDIRFGSPMK